MSDHDKAANRLAKKFKTVHKHEGIDIRIPGMSVEVAVTDDDIYQSIGQLNRSRAEKKFLSVPSGKVEKAKELLEGTGMGVMNLDGKIKKRTRKKAK